jgi:hypothetical protein
MIKTYNFLNLAKIVLFVVILFRYNMLNGTYSILGQTYKYLQSMFIIKVYIGPFKYYVST